MSFHFIHSFQLEYDQATNPIVKHTFLGSIWSILTKKDGVRKMADDFSAIFPKTRIHSIHANDVWDVDEDEEKKNE